MRKIALLATDGFEESELKSPLEFLKKKGFIVDIVSPVEKERVRSWSKTDWGPDYKVDVPLAQARASNYVALVLPGGVLNPDSLRVNREALDFINAFAEDQKLIAAICHGPWTLIEIGFVKGRFMTSVNNIKSDLIHAGATWKDAEVVVDRNLITSRTPDDLPAFNEAIGDYLNS